jgi:Flp pilus assembly pilin Flp
MTLAGYAAETGRLVCRKRKGNKDAQENEKRTIGTGICGFIFRGGGGFNDNSDVPAPGISRQFTYFAGTTSGKSKVKKKGGEKMRIARNRKGQNMVEYLVIIGAIIAVLIGLRTVFTTQVNSGMTGLATKINGSMGNLGQ